MPLFAKLKKIIFDFTDFSCTTICFQWEGEMGNLLCQFNKRNIFQLALKNTGVLCNNQIFYGALLTYTKCTEILCKPIYEKQFKWTIFKIS